MKKKAAFRKLAKSVEQWETWKHLHSIKILYWIANIDLVKQSIIMHDMEEGVFRAPVNDLYNKMVGSRLEVIGS